MNKETEEKVNVFALSIATGVMGYMFYAFFLIAKQGYAHLVEPNYFILGIELLITFFCCLYLLFKTLIIFLKKGERFGKWIKKK